MNDNIIFKSSSTSKVFPFYLANIIGLVFLGYLLLHFQENPTVIGVIMALIAVVICFNSRKICVVMDDRFKIIFNRFIPAFSSSKEFFYTEIASIEARLPLTQATTTGFISDFLTNRNSFRTTPENTITLRYHDGRVKQLSLNISREDLEQAFAHIQKLSSISVTAS